MLVAKLFFSLPYYEIKPLHIFTSQGSSLELPIGTILPYVGNLADIPDRWHLCDGTDDTPDLRGRFLEGADISGSFIDSGLPNIFGYFTMRQGGYNVLMLNQHGCIQPYSAANLSGSIYTNANTTGTLYGYKIDASLSSPIYGRSETVQPPAYTVYYIMKVI